MKRRAFITLLGGAAIGWPLAARAQQTGRVWRVAVIGASSPLPAMLTSAEANARYMTAFRKGLNETGTVEDQNVTVEYHWLEGLLFLTQRPVPRLLTLAMTRKKFGP